LGVNSLFEFIKKLNLAFLFFAIISNFTSEAIIQNLNASAFIPTEQVLKKTLSKKELKQKLEELFNSKEAKDIFWGVKIIDLDEGTDLFNLNQDKQFRPASNMKLVIASAALKALSPNFRFETKLFTDGVIKKDVLNGNLIILGSGDPTFRTEDLDNWYQALKKLGIKKIRGSIIGVDTIFDDKRMGLLWSWRDISNCYSAQISGLQINNNCVEVQVTPSKKNQFPMVKKIPETSYVHVYNRAKTNGLSSRLGFSRQPETNKIVVSGNIKSSLKELKRWVSVDNPTLYFLTLFYEGMNKNGIKLTGKIIDARDIGYTLDHKKATMLSSHKSPPLRSIISDFLKHSINLYGESILKTLGFVYFNEGTTYNGRLAVNLILKQFNLPEKNLFIADGSGLSVLNLMSPEYIASLLKGMSKTYQYGTFVNSLSKSGMDGTLSARLNTNYMRGAVHAKTGYLSTARSLSGYIDTMGNKRLAFAVFANNFKNNLNQAESIIDKACTIMRFYSPKETKLSSKSFKSNIN
jgi:serine-type D-Ala-D-Ala carboxypeptidase/endopeptidase (penicillin-binding protein 4)